MDKIYQLTRHGHESEYIEFKVKNCWTEEVDDIVSDFGEYFYDNCDGWECDWPIKFNLYAEDGKYIGTALCEMEMRPHFHARKCNPDETTK